MRVYGYIYTYCVIMQTSTPGVYDVQDAYVDPIPETDIEHVRATIYTYALC